MTATALAHFQQDFAHALFAPARGQAEGLTGQPAFAVYRNTVMKGCIDALEANYPSVVRLVGRDWFRSAAALHVAADPPRDGRLVHYGSAFPAFLRSFAPAAELPYLADVARLDRFWTEAHVAADAPALDAAALVRLAPEALGTRVLAPHPSARWAWFGAAPIYTIWQRNRPEGDALADLHDIPWQAEGALLVRVDDTVRWQPASAAECAFLDACARGRCLLAAATEALSVDASTDIAALLSALLRAGVFAAGDLPPSKVLKATP